MSKLRFCGFVNKLELLYQRTPAVDMQYLFEGLFDMSKVEVLFNTLQQPLSKTTRNCLLGVSNIKHTRTTKECGSVPCRGKKFFRL
jgi:hypothetical protein